MLKKSIVAILLAFAVVSIAFAFVDKKSEGGSENTPDTPTASAERPDRVALYYFHRTKRCTACKEIEAYTDELLKAEFADALKDGRLVWKRFNVEHPDHEHFIAELGLKWQHLMVIRFKGGKQVDAVDLKEIWDLRPQKDLFVAYVKQGVAEALAQVGKSE